MRRTCAILFVIFVFESLVTGRLIERHRGEAFIGYSETADARVVVLTVSGYGEVRGLFVLCACHGVAYHVAHMIRMRLFRGAAPSTSKLITDLARTGSSPSSNFYRHEHVPQKWGEDGFWGPPYALLQGSLADMAQTPPMENTIPIERGHVCIIPNTKEFFIATARHPEWGAAHSVVGQVDDFIVVDRVPFEPSFTRFDGTYTTTWLNTSVPFSIHLDA